MAERRSMAEAVPEDLHDVWARLPEELGDELFHKPGDGEVSIDRDKLCAKLKAPKPSERWKELSVRVTTALHLTARESKGPRKITFKDFEEVYNNDFTRLVAQPPSEALYTYCVQSDVGKAAEELDRLRMEDPSGVRLAREVLGLHMGEDADDIEEASDDQCVVNVVASSESPVGLKMLLLAFLSHHGLIRMLCQAQCTASGREEAWWEWIETVKSKAGKPSSLSAAHAAADGEAPPELLQELGTLARTRPSSRVYKWPPGGFHLEKVFMQLPKLGALLTPLYDQKTRCGADGARTRELRTRALRCERPLCVPPLAACGRAGTLRPTAPSHAASSRSAPSARKSWTSWPSPSKASRRVRGSSPQAYARWMARVVRACGAPPSHTRSLDGAWRGRARAQAWLGLRVPRVLLSPPRTPNACGRRGRGRHRHPEQHLGQDQRHQ
jgi:hypothetical protein